MPPCTPRAHPLNQRQNLQLTDKSLDYRRGEEGGDGVWGEHTKKYEAVKWQIHDLQLPGGCATPPLYCPPSKCVYSNGN